MDLAEIKEKGITIQKSEENGFKSLFANGKYYLSTF